MAVIANQQLSPNKKWKAFWAKAMPYMLILPVVLYYAIFWLRPVFELSLGSFIGAEGEFTLGNYAMVFQDPYFTPAFLNTAIIVVFSVSLEFIVALLLALLINEKFPGSGMFLFLAMIPMALPAAAVAAMWLTGLTAHGWINSLLHHIGFLAGNEKIFFLTGENWKNLILIIIVDAWQVIPSVMIILLAGLQNIPEESKEAGLVFGGNWWTVLRKITIPMLKPTIQTAVILRLISAIQIWLIVAILFGFNRLPVLLERVVYYSEEVPNLDISYQMASTYTVVVAIIVSLAALAFLYVSGAFKKQPEEM